MSWPRQPYRSAPVLYHENPCNWEIVVRIRDHMALSTAGAALLFPWLRGRVLWPWAASIVIDADHYLWFCVQHRRLNPVAAVRYFNQAQPTQHRRTRLFHSPAALL